MGGQKMSTQELQEIIVNNSIRSFNQGYSAGATDERRRILEVVVQSRVSATSMVDGTVIEGITITPTELIKLIEDSK
jgi:hypothetical protein